MKSANLKLIVAFARSCNETVRPLHVHRVGGTKQLQNRQGCVTLVLQLFGREILKSVKRFLKKHTHKRFGFMTLQCEKKQMIEARARVIARARCI